MSMDTATTSNPTSPADYYYAKFVEVICPDCEDSVLECTKREAVVWARQHAHQHKQAQTIGEPR